MDAKVERLKTPEECEIFAENVRDRRRLDLAVQATRRAVELRAAKYGAKSQVEIECLEAVFAYEETLYAKHGKRVRASRTWQVIENKGITQAVDDIVSREAPTVGYVSLVEMGLQDFAFEAVVLRHPSGFSAEARRRSEQRLKKWQSESSGR